MTPFLHRLNTRLRGISLTKLAEDNDVINRAYTVVSFFYFLLPLAAVMYFKNTHFDRPNFDPLWSVAWAHALSLPYLDALLIVSTGFLVIALCAPLFYTRRWMRIAVCIALFQAHALESSFSGPNHQWYPWLYTAFIFIFLPDRRDDSSIEQRRLYLLYVWCAQALFTCIYALAGWHKIIYALIQAHAGEIHGLSSLGFSYQVADWIPKLNQQAVLAAAVVEHPHIAFPFYLALIGLQISAPLVMLYPVLQRSWAVAIFAFHFGTFLVMGIEFTEWMLLIPILFMPAVFYVPTKDLNIFAYVTRIVMRR